MRGLLPTETVVVETGVVTGQDKMGNPVVSYIPHTVDGCLVTPAGEETLKGSLSDLQGVLYRVHIPSDVELVSPKRVILRGDLYKVVNYSGRVTQSPLPWDRSYLVEGVFDG